MTSILLTGILGALVASASFWFALGLHHSDFEKKNRGRFKLRRRLVFIAATAGLLGALLLCIAPSYHHRPEIEDLMRDIARAFMAAAIIGYIIELAEIRDFFSNLLTHLLTSSDYTRQLSNDELDRHCVDVAAEKIRRAVTNPEHAGQSLVRPVMIATFPHLCESYRESYDERIHFSVINTTEEMEDLVKRAWSSGVESPDLTAPAYLLECRASFFLVPVEEAGTEFAGTILIDAKLIPGWDVKHHARCTIRLADGHEHEVPLTSRPDGALHVYVGKYSVPLTGRRTRVEIKTWEFNSNQRTGFNIEMTTMTRGLTVVFDSDLDLYPEIWTFALNEGMGSESPSTDRRVASYSRADLILLAGHGYGVSWSFPINETQSPDREPVN
jgi:hypothetical protein